MLDLPLQPRQHHSIRCAISAFFLIPRCSSAADLLQLVLLNCPSTPLSAGSAKQEVIDKAKGVDDEHRAALQYMQLQHYQLGVPIEGNRSNTL